MTGIKLELISDVDMHLMIEKGLRGGMSVISHRKAEANNKYMTSYDPEKPSKYITYLDANSLYSWSIIQYLPYGEFKRIDPEMFHLNNVSAESETGHILEVDLLYPKEIHESNNDHPFCCKHKILEDDMLSPYAKSIANKHELASGKSSKLLASMNNNTKYVIHGMNLKQAVDAGLILTEIHRVIEFKQKPWMKDFIDFNINKRKESKNQFEKGFFKIMSNATHGRTLMNLRKRQNISFINDATKLNDCVKKPDFISSKIFTCCKILECVVASEIICFLNSHNLITKQQHGFLQKHSTVTNLLESVNDWTFSLSNRKSVVIAYIDFKRAFDAVSHSKLIHKLAAYGIHGNLLFWIASFLSNRKQYVRVGSSLSSLSLVTSGVPQGSVIGHLLFNLFINDITDNLDSSTTSKIFADDIKLYTEFSTTISPQHLQTHLDLINQWSITWQLPISHSKCNILVLGRHALNQPFSISDVIVPTVDFNLDLGVTVDSDLKFTTHITNIVKKAKQRSALIHRCFLSRNIPSLIRAFQTYVRPIVEYATHIWSPHFLNSINLIESVQRSFTKRLPGLGDFSCHERLSILELKSLEHRRFIFDLILCYNIVHGHNSLSFNDFFSFFNNPSSRGHSLKLAFPTVKSDTRKYFFSTRVVKIWNALPTNIVHAPSTHSFKSLLSYHDLTNFLVIPTFNVTK